MTISDLSEHELVARIQQQLAPPPPWVTLGIGDDAAVIEPERNRLEVFTVDAVIDGVHVDRRFTPPFAIGHRALAVNLSDLAAMGATPRLALLSLALPADVAVDDFDQLIAGVASLARLHGVAVVGGNLTRTPGPLTVDITAVGSVKRRGALTRAGAKPGDHVYVTGTLGAAAAGLSMLQHGARPDAADAGCIGHYLHPVPRVRPGLLIGRNRAATACIDLSDGLADGLARIAAASAVGFVIDKPSLPIADEARRWFDGRGEDPVGAALTGGDDYELLFTVRPRLRGRLHAVRRHGQVALTRIGICTDDGQVLLASADGRRQTVGGGYSHFR